MRAWAVMLAAAATYMSGIAGGVYLTMHGHPVVAVLIVLLSFCVSFKSGNGE